MISSERSIYKLTQALNKLSTNDHQAIEVEDAIIWLNQAQIELVKRKITGPKDSRLGFESFTKRYEELKDLVVAHQEIPMALTDQYLNKYSGKLTSLTPKYMMYIDSYILADKKKCTDRVLAGNLVKHADVPVLVRNASYKPSFEYQETLVTLSSEEAFDAYTDGSFKLVKAFVSYLKYPQQFDYPGYIRFDGSSSFLQDSDLPEFLEDEVILIATQIISAATENTSAFQAAQARSQTND